MLDYKGKDDKALLADLIFNNPDLGCKKILQVYGLSKALELVTLRELKGLFAKHGKRNWYGLMAEMKEIKIHTTEKLIWPNKKKYNKIGNYKN